MITIILELDQQTEARARARGLLTPEAIRAWVESELAREEDTGLAQDNADDVERQREATWEHLFRSMEAVRSGAASKYAHLSEEEMMDVVNEEIEAMRAEKRAQKNAASQDEA
jgi:hypothetical protein